MRKAVWVLVLGDLGRSPRMQYHTISLLETLSAHVVLLGYLRGLDGLRPELRDAYGRGDLHIMHIPDWRFLGIVPPRPLYWLTKLLLQMFVIPLIMLQAALKFGIPKAILVQSPPAVPALAVCAFMRVLFTCRLILDYHNIGYTLMRRQLTRTGSPHLLSSDSIPVHVAAQVELWGIKRFDSVVTVSEGLKTWLQANCKTRVEVLRDHAPAFFKPVDCKTAHALLCRLRDTAFVPVNQGALFLPACWHDGGTPITAEDIGSGTICWREAPRPAIIVSSTSWSDDENLQLLLDAVALYDKRSTGKDQSVGLVAPLIVVITGKGPNKEQYLARVAAMALDRVAICAAWLDAADYAPLLGCADLGVSLHVSSSGLDLPMKVSDMLGCGLEVCMYDYPVAHEQCGSTPQGHYFQGAEELAEIWVRLLGLDERCGPRHHLLSEDARGARQRSAPWEEKWNRLMPGLLALEC